MAQEGFLPIKKQEEYNLITESSSGRRLYSIKGILYENHGGINPESTSLKIEVYSSAKIIQVQSPFKSPWIKTHQEFLRYLNNNNPFQNPKIRKGIEEIVRKSLSQLSE